MKILVAGPSGSGKSYISSELRKLGVNAVDADLVIGLHGWFDGQGNRVKFPKNAGPEFLDNHSFLWNRDFLKQYLEKQDEIYLFGSSGNFFEMIDIFDKLYFLKASPEILEKRLADENRENPMGKTKFQRQRAIEYAKQMEEKAKSLGFIFTDSTLTPEEIYKLISQ